MSVVLEVKKILAGNMDIVDRANRIKQMRTTVQTQLDDGVHCPTCGQFAKVYKRQITGTSAAALIAMYKACGYVDYVYLPDVLDRKQADEAKLTHWGLIEEKPISRTDGGRAGWWKLTDDGVRFVLGRLSVPKYAHIYDSKLMGMSGDPVTIQDCLGKKFNYQELMDS